MSIQAQGPVFSFHSLGEQLGLARAGTYKISQDSKGFIWIGTDEGLQRFNGFELQTLRHFHNSAFEFSGEDRVTSKCIEDTNGNLWFTTMDALHCYIYSEDRFLSFKASESLAHYQLFHQDQKEVLWLKIGKEEEGALWLFDTKEQVFQQQFPLRGTQNYIIKEVVGERNLLITTQLEGSSGLEIIDLSNQQRQIIRFDNIDDGRKRSYSSPTNGLHYDDSGVMWTGVYNGLGYFLPGNLEGLTSLRRHASIPEDIGFVSGIIPYDSIHLLVTATDGLFLFDRETRQFVSQILHRTKQNDNISKPNVLFEDNGGTIWVGGTQNEISFFNRFKSKFKIAKLSEGKSIATITADARGRIWASSIEKGTFVYNKKGTLQYQTTSLDNLQYPDETFSLPYLEEFIEGKQANSWWGRLANQFVCWNEEDKAFFYKYDFAFHDRTMSGPIIKAMYHRNNGEQLVALGSALFRLSLKAEIVDTSNWLDLAYLNLGTINFLWEDKKEQLYIGDESGRLTILEASSKQTRKIASFERIGRVYSIRPDHQRNVSWIATSRGLAQLNVQNKNLVWLTAVKDALPEAPFYDAILDGSGQQLWLPGQRGLLRYDLNQKKVHRFNITDGLPSVVFNPLASFISKENGLVWLGTKQGLVYFHPDSIQLLDRLPPVEFAQILINDLSYNFNESIHALTGLSLPYEENTLSFRFSALDYSDPEENEFYYQLEGYDDQWVYAGSNNFVRYPNLPPGNYTFKVWATNSDKALNPTPKTLPITIIPPFYQTWWFYLLCTIIISAIIYGIFKYRLEQALKVERLRVKISSDLHDDVGGLLSGLAMQTEVLELTATEEVKPKLQRIAELSRSAMSRMRDTVWAIDARKDKLENLLDRMREHAEETLAPKDFHYDIISENIDLTTKLPTDIRQNLYLIYKEAITNIAKHSNGELVEVTLKKAGTQFKMSIYDNGKVKDKDYKTTGLGQSNMKMRAKQIGASMQTIRDNGYQIIIRMKSF